MSFQSESGNVAIYNEDTDILWLLDDEGKRVVKKISCTKGSSSTWRVIDKDISVKELAKQINEEYQGWNIIKMNIDGVNIEDDYGDTRVA